MQKPPSQSRAPSSSPVPIDNEDVDDKAADKEDVNDEDVLVFEQPFGGSDDFVGEGWSP